jgi:hypothetical protein
LAESRGHRGEGNALAPKRRGALQGLRFEIEARGDRSERARTATNGRGGSVLITRIGPSGVPVEITSPAMSGVQSEQYNNKSGSGCLRAIAAEMNDAQVRKLLVNFFS